MPISRRKFVLGSAALPAIAQKKSAVERPGILLIAADNLPAWVLGIYGNKEIRTPNIDRLAQTGIRFTRHFACAPSPGPGFTTLLTGRTPMQLGGAAASQGGIEKVLSGLGYEAKVAAGADASSFLDQQSPGKPFFLAVHDTSLQPPYSGAPQKFQQMYAQVRFESLDTMPVSSRATRGKEMFSDLTGSLRKAAAAITAFDDQVGAFLAKLSARRLRETTLIILTGTCGALLGRHGLWDGADGSDPPNLYEEVVATPMIWSWLGRVPAQATRPELVSAYDLLPTLCEIAGANPPGANLCGRSYLLLATGKPLSKNQPWPTTVFSRFGTAEMSREDRYKVVLQDGGKGANELYDLVADPHEKVNQYENPGFVTIRSALAGELAKWKQKYSA